MELPEVHKQLAKLAFKKEEDVQAYLKQLKRWITEVEQLYDEFPVKLVEMVSDLQHQYDQDFNREVAKLDFASLLFQARAGKLTLDGLRKTLNTPAKVVALATKLSIASISALPDRDYISE